MKAQFLIYFLNNQTNIKKKKKKKNQLTIRNNSLNWIKLKEVNLSLDSNAYTSMQLYYMQFYLIRTGHSASYK